MVWAIKEFNLRRKINNLISLGIGAAIKTLFLFSAAFILVNVNILPAIFLTAMGLMQLYTAIAGGLLAFGVHTVKKRLA